MTDAEQLLSTFTADRGQELADRHSAIGQDSPLFAPQLCKGGGRLVELL